MVKDGEEIEDAVKHCQDLESDIGELDSKPTNSTNKVDGEKMPGVFTDAGDPNGLKKEAQENISLDNENEDQPNPQTETNESMPVEGSTDELVVNATSKNEDRSNAKTNVEEQTVNGPVDAKNEVVEQNAFDGGVKVEKSTENVDEGGNPAINVVEEKNVDNGVEGETFAENILAERNADNGVNEESPIKNVLEEKNVENSLEEGNRVYNVTAERNAENLVEGGEHPGKHVTEENLGIEFSVEKDNNSEMTTQNTQFTTDIPSNEAPPSQNAALDKALIGGDEEMEDTANKVTDVKEVDQEPKEQGNEILLASHVETMTKHEGNYSSLPIKEEAAATPSSLVRYMPSKAGDLSGETAKTVYAQDLMPEGDDGTPEDQAAFMNEIESFYRGRAMDFKPPKFYGQPLNCLKLWRSVIRLGGYDRVTGSKLWRQVGESFHPPKTCTTVSWTFRIFYEKSLLEYERHKTQSGELIHPAATLHEASGADTEGNGYQGSGPGTGRGRKDASARAIQGWHVQRPFGNGEVGEPVVKDKNINTIARREKNVKTLGSLKQKRPNEVEPSVKVARIETSKQLATTVVDVGPPADWVKVNVRQTKDCFEVYALVPGLLREEVRVQSDPAGRLVITGQPEQVDNPWGITPFKKVISLPLRIDPLQTSAVVSLHGRLFVRVPFEQSNS